MKVRPGTPPPFRLELLEAKHPIAAFSCGDPAIDSFLHSQALTEQTLGLSTATVAVEVLTGAIAGYFTLSPLSVRLDPRVLAALKVDAQAIPYRNVGGYLLGRLGVDTAYAGQRIGPALVATAIANARRARVETGGVFIGVDAKKDWLLAWYAKLGFTQVSGTNRLVMRL